MSCDRAMCCYPSCSCKVPLPATPERSARRVVSENLMQALREQHAADVAQRRCQHLWPHYGKPMPASWMCACGTKVYRSYEDAVDD